MTQDTPLTAKQILQQGTQQMGYKVDDNAIEKLLLYVQNIIQYNKIHNLVGTSCKKELCINHILDSLVALKHIKDLLSCMSYTKPFVLDAGSGAGFPGVPLSIVANDIDFLLCERQEKRYNFLFQCLKTLQIQNAKVAPFDIKDLKPKSFDIITFRAFKPLEPKLLKELFSKLKDTGAIVAYKGKKQKIQEELSPLHLRQEQYNVIELCVPFLEDHERHLVVIKK